MNRLFAALGSALIIATMAGPAESSSPSLYAAAAPKSDVPTELRLTESDVAASNKKAGAAYSALVDMWTDEFRRVGARFVAPKMLRYRGAVRTGCGVMAPSNASYCLNNNTIYFDDVFVAAQAKVAAHSLGTDGDMSGIGIIAHEMGHAVAMQLGYRSRRSYDNEAAADCLAGAFARQAQTDGSLEDGDIDEAFFGMAAAGDPTPELTGDRRTDRRLAARIAMSSHGTREQRVQNFRNGLEGGGAACLDELR
jgi:uncharacterized protein